MNVALIMERIETWRGGAETSTNRFAHCLAGRGCKVTMVTASHVASTPAVTVVPIKTSDTLRAGRTWLFVQRAGSYIREQDFDIVHSITPFPAADLYQPRGGTVPETLARNIAVRSTAVQRGLKWFGQRLSLKYQVTGRLERQLLRRRPPPWVIAISQYVSDQLSRHYQFDRARVRLIFNGVDPDRASPEQRQAHRRAIRRQLHLADDDLMVLCIAHNFKLKGVGSLIEAVARRCADRRDRTYTVIVGRDNPAPFARLVERLGLAEHIFFVGPTQRIQAFFHAADLLAHPTFYDPCSRVVLEAMAAGLPVITTRFNGAAERITDGQQGYVIDSPRDVDALADRIDRLADNAHRRACGRESIRAVESISMEDHAAAVLALYEDIVRSGELKRSPYR